MHIGKRGQSTLLVVLGIVLAIIIIIAVVIFNYSSDITGIMPFSSAVSNIRSFVESCNQELARNSLIFLGAQGGRYKNLMQPFKQENDNLGEVQLSHFVYGGKYIEFTLDDVENEINEYYADNLPLCLNNFDEYKNKGYVIEASGMNVEVNFDDEDTIFNLNYGIAISKSDKSEKLSTYPEVAVPYRFKKVFEVASESAKIHASTGSIPVNYVLGNHISLMNYDVGQSIIYRLIDNKNDEEKKYVFYFAVN